jgi:hypothetical protein
VSQAAKGSRLHQRSARNQRLPRVPDQWSTSHTRLSSVPPDCPVCHGANGWQRSDSPRKEGNHTLFIIRCAPDSPVHPWTEGNQALPNEDQTTPLALGVIKGPPQCMVLQHKHSLSILQLRDSTTTLLFHYIEIWAHSWAVTPLFVSCTLFLTRVIVCMLLLLIKFLCVASPPYSCALIKIICVRCERLQLVEIPHKGDLR